MGMEYNLAQDAYVSKVGEDLSETMGIGSKDDVLFVVFAKSNRDSTVPTNESALCFYTLKKIIRKFTSGIQQCFNGVGTQGLRFMSDDLPCSYINYREIQDDFCGSGILHPIQIQRSLTAQDFLWYSGHGSIFTSVLVNIYDRHTIVLIGTDAGVLMKVIVNAEGENSPHELRKPYQNITLTNNSPIKQDMVMDNSNQYIFVMSDQQVFKVPVHTCSLYTDCSVCVTTPDPVECGWCEGKSECSTRQDCVGNGVLWGRSTCPPTIHTVATREGPIEGGTLVTISGDNLGVGIGQNTHQVTVAGQFCEPLPEQSSVHELVCRTKPNPHGRGPVSVTIHHASDDASLGYIVDGTTVSNYENSFSYVDPVINNFTPKFGAQSGGTKVVVDWEISGCWN
uniref:Plexin-A2-like n=1 Tax=Saccoglossus kowalevskii TaxID=10224 RepID=A0ABM0MLR4_SACKO|nr:PREDICTED: plexin-A2-like [Saccoglossus kowalevskii]